MLGELNKSNVPAYRGKYDPSKTAPYKISRSKIELLTDCARCFYLDRRLGIGRPQFPPFLLNSAVDTLLKKEFDVHRAKGTTHPLMETYKIDAIPYAHKQMDTWRENFVGVEALHKPTNLLIHGAVDDIWESPNGELMVVDYKATSKSAGVSIEGYWQQSYKRQLEVYQWLMRQNGFNVSDTGYFVYANGRTDSKAFDGKLEFDVTIIPYKGSDGWVEGAIENAHRILNQEEIPEAKATCEYCNYASARKSLEKNEGVST